MNVSDVMQVLANISSKRETERGSPTRRVLDEEANSKMVGINVD